jgi:hypothetical protein
MRRGAHIDVHVIAIREIEVAGTRAGRADRVRDCGYETEA